MSNNFNLKNYINLVNKQDLTETERSELLSYQASIEGQISYNRKQEYFSLIKEYLAKKIDPNIFRGKFLMMQEQDSNTQEIMEDDFEQLSNFSIDLESKKERFFSLIDVIYNNSMIAIEFGPEGEDGISEEEFKVCIENAFSKFSE